MLAPDPGVLALALRLLEDDTKIENAAPSNSHAEIHRRVGCTTRKW
jgi:hypothetical protein